MAGRNVHTREPLIGRRADGRLRLRIQARLITLDGTIRLVLADLSRWGARIEAPDAYRPPLSVGQDAVLAWDRFEAFGTAVWTDGNQSMGMRFEEALSREALLATRELEDQRLLSPEKQQLRDAARAFVQGRRRV